MKNTQRKEVQRDEQPAGEEPAEGAGRGGSHDQERPVPVDDAPNEGNITENESGQEPTVPVLLTTEEQIADRLEDEAVAPVATPVETRSTRKQARKRAKEGEQLEDELKDPSHPQCFALIEGEIRHFLCHLKSRFFHSELKSSYIRANTASLGLRLLSWP